MRHGPTNVAQDGTEPRAAPRPTGPHAVTHPLPLGLVIFSHPHIPTQTPHKIFSPHASIPSPLACTHSRASLTVTSYSCLSIHASLEYVIRTHTLSRPCQIRQLHIHTCYILSRTPLI